MFVFFVSNAFWFSFPDFVRIVLCGTTMLVQSCTFWHTQCSDSLELKHFYNNNGLLFFARTTCTHIFSIMLLAVAAAHKTKGRPITYECMWQRLCSAAAARVVTMCTNCDRYDFITHTHTLLKWNPTLNPTLYRFTSISFRPYASVWGLRWNACKLLTVHLDAWCSIGSIYLKQIVDKSRD